MTARLAVAMGIGAHVLPMTEDEVSTRIETAPENGGAGRDPARDLCSRFVPDTTDAAEADAIRAMGLHVATAPTRLHRGTPAAGLIAAIVGRTVGNRPASGSALSER